MFIAALFAVAKIWKQHYQWINKENVVYMYNITLSAFKKTEILPFVTMWMKLQGIVSSEMSKREILSDSTSMKSIK